MISIKRRQPALSCTSRSEHTRVRPKVHTQIQKGRTHPHHSSIAATKCQTSSYRQPPSPSPPPPEHPFPLLSSHVFVFKFHQPHPSITPTHVSACVSVPPSCRAVELLTHQSLSGPIRVKRSRTSASTDFPSLQVKLTSFSSKTGHQAAEPQI